MRWNWPFGRRSRDAEIDEEIQSHLRMSIEDHIARGESPEQAQTSASREFGNRGLVKEDARAVWAWVTLERLFQDIRYTLRQMRRSPGFTATVILTLALGLGINLTVFLLVSDFFLRPLPAEDPEQLVYVMQRSPRIELPAGLSYPDYRDLRDAIEAGREQEIGMASAFAGLLAFRQEPVAVSGAEAETERTWVAQVSDNFFDVLGVGSVLMLLSMATQPSAEEIVSRAIAVVESQYEDLAIARFESRQVSVTESLNAKGEVTKSKTLLYQQRPLEGALYGELIEKDGLPLTDRERREEDQRREKFIEEVRKRRARGEHPQPVNDPDIRFNHYLMDRYRLELTGKETVRGHTCWVIGFEPREGKLPSGTRMDPAMNKSAGRLWISQQDYGLVRMEFAMREPFRYAGGLLLTLRQAEGLVDFERFADGTWLQLSSDFKLDLRVLMVKNIRLHIASESSEYRLADLPN